MPIYFSCPHGHSLAVGPEHAGQKVRCPLCQEIVTAPNVIESAAPVVAAVVPPLPPPLPEAPAGYRLADEPPPARPLPAPEAVYEIGLPPDRPGLHRRPSLEEGADEGYAPGLTAGKKTGRRERLRRVKLGLAFHYWKYLCFVIGILLYTMGQLLSHPLPALGLLLLLVSGLGTLTSPILGIVGSILCSWVPARSRARALVLVSLGFDAGSLAALLLALPVAAVTGNLFGAGAALVLLLLCPVFGITGFILFMVFLKKLAYYLDDEPSGDEAIAAMVAYLLVLFGGVVVILISAVVLVRVAVLLAQVVVLVEYVGWLVFTVQVLFRILKVIDNLRARI